MDALYTGVVLAGARVQWRFLNYRGDAHPSPTPSPRGVRRPRCARPLGSTLWVQERHVALKFPLALAHGLAIDGVAGPKTCAALAAA